MTEASPALQTAEPSPLDTAVAGSRLPHLVALAQETSSESRRALLRELTDHFFGSTAPRSGAAPTSIAAAASASVAWVRAVSPPAAA